MVKNINYYWNSEDMEAKTGGSTPAPPPSTRRPRVREVSSRFMTPVTSSSSSSSAGDLHFFTSNSPKHNHHQIQRSVSAQRHRRQLKMAEGDENRSSETAARSLDSPFTLSKGGKVSKQGQSKVLKENSNRFDTPTPIVPPPSKSRFSQQRLPTGSAATKLLQLSGISASSENDQDQVPIMLSCRTHSKVFNNFVPSPFNRTLSSPLSSCNGRESSSFSRMGLSLPPVPPNSKIPVDTKKQRKVSEQMEEVHSLKLLHNRYLQWRFANANTEVKSQAQRAQTEALLYSFGLKISELRDSVQRKRIELQSLSRARALRSITESQTPCLEQWSAIEEEYSASLSQTIQALSNASLRLPLDADIMFDNKELAEALVVASKVMDNITQNIGSYLAKAQELDNLVSELTRVSKRERSLIENCGITLLETQASIIEECSLKSQLIQHQKKHHVSEHNSSSL